jgi:hypothetical protein
MSTGPALKNLDKVFFMQVDKTKPRLLIQICMDP